METRRWTNPHQPQTLQIAVILLYISAVFTLIGFSGGIYASLGSRVGLGVVAALLAGGAMAAGGFGVANEKRWGYNLAVAVTGLGVLELLLLVAEEGVGLVLNPSFLLLALFPVARFALLVHPMSRHHQRIWFS